MKKSESIQLYKKFPWHTSPAWAHGHWEFFLFSYVLLLLPGSLVTVWVTLGTAGKPCRELMWRCHVLPAPVGCSQSCPCSVPGTRLHQEYKWMDPTMPSLRNAPTKEKKDKLESASKTLHDSGLKLVVIFREHTAEWKAGWNIYLIMHKTK